jgi:hypothetical protein
MAKLKLVPAAFDPKQADIKEAVNQGKNEKTLDSDREREYAGRIENASERFETPVLPTREEQEDEENLKAKPKKDRAI